MRLSGYKAGTILVDGNRKVFIHDGFVNDNGYGVIIGENYYGVIQKSMVLVTGWRKATVEKQLDEKSWSSLQRLVKHRRLSITNEDKKWAKKKVIKLIKDSLLEIPDIDADRGYPALMRVKKNLDEMLKELEDLVWIVKKQQSYYHSLRHLAKGKI